MSLQAAAATDELRRAVTSASRGCVPRRAVVVDGAVHERVDHPDAPEVDVLSRVCAAVRKLCDQPVYPRATAELVMACLTTNDAEAWASLYADSRTGDMDLDVAVTKISEGPAEIVRCLVYASSEMHLLSVCCVLTSVLPVVTDEARKGIGRELSAQLEGVVGTFSRIGLRKTMRETALSALGKVLAATDAPPARLADCLLDLLDTGRDDVTRLFVHVSEAMVRVRPQLLGAVLDRAERLPPGSRYGPLALLARVLRDTHVRGLQTRILAVVESELEHAARSDPDARVMLVCSLLARHSEDKLVCAMAQCLELAAGAAM